MPYSRAQKRYITIQRARRRLENRLADMDWELDELEPDVKQLGELEASENVTVELEAGEDEASDR